MLVLTSPLNTVGPTPDVLRLNANARS